jgi:hypothetical protein
MEPTTCYRPRSQSFGSRRSGMTMSKPYKNCRPLFSSSSPSHGGALASRSRDAPAQGFRSCGPLRAAALPFVLLSRSRRTLPRCFLTIAVPSRCPRGVALFSSEACTAKATARHSEKPETVRRESGTEKGQRAQADHALVRHLSIVIAGR